MNKRQFLAVAATSSAALPISALAKKSNASPTLLTITGAITNTNRGAIDPALDQMMVKQKLQFSKAYAFDFAALSALASTTIKPTLEYDGKPHALKGPFLIEVLKSIGAEINKQTKFALRAVDGYAAIVTLEDLQKYRFIIATHLDERPMPLGGLGPLWAVYDADQYPEMAAKPVNERFGSCPWALYHIDVLNA